jgi:hypothetical protein
MSFDYSTPLLPGVSNMFDAQAVIGVLLIFSGLNVDPPFGNANAPGIRVFNNRGSPAFSLHVSLKFFKSQNIILKNKSEIFLVEDGDKIRYSLIT